MRLVPTLGNKKCFLYETAFIDSIIYVYNIYIVVLFNVRDPKHWAMRVDFALRGKWVLKVSRPVLRMQN